MGVHFNYNKDIYYTMTPRIFPVGSTVEITVRDTFGARELPDSLIVRVIPTMIYHKGALAEDIIVKVEEGGFSFAYAFAAEQLYLVRLLTLEEESLYVEFSVYALEDDLFGRRPLKGDLHMHTTCSDGTETPKHRLATARKLGLDFLSVTDHNVYEGSLKAIEELSRVPNRMVALRGEEVHAGTQWFQDAPCNVHILSLDADYAISPFKAFASEEEFQQRLVEMEDAFDEQVVKFPWLATMGQDAAIETLRETKARRARLRRDWEGKLGDVDLDVFVYTLDVFEEIGRAGGFSVFCHPLWRLVWDSAAERRLDLSLDLVRAIIEAKPFDVYEIASYADQDENARNTMQEKLLQEAGLLGSTPIIGITDSHTTMEGLNILGNVYTVAFVEEPTVEGIRRAILDLYSVAVDDYPNEDARCHGSFRLSCFTEFLIDHLFPMHDANTQVEGQLMMKYYETEDADLLPMIAKVCAMNAAEEAAWWASSQKA